MISGRSSLVIFRYLWYNYKHYSLRLRDFMKLGRVWDYVMRRKRWFVILLAALISGSIIGGKLWSTHGGFFLASSPSDSIETPVYNNSLILKIASSAASAPSYQLTFTNNFRHATAKISDSPLENEAYVRIFDASGKLVRGEYTQIREQTVTPVPGPPPAPSKQPDNTTEDGVDGDSAENVPETPVVTAVEYVFANAPLTYEVELAPGSIIEIHAAEAKFYSTLDGEEAVAFRPVTTERYIVTTNGFRKETWSELEGELQIYALLKRQIVHEIETYQAQLSDAVLNNRHLDIANKTRVTLAYRQLQLADQEAYADFIEHLARGGVPVLSYTGTTEFVAGSAAPDWHDNWTATDGEDGEIDPAEITVTGEVDLNKAGEYTLTARAVDSDGNEGTAEVKITVTGPINPQPLPPVEEPGLNNDEDIDPPADSPSNDPLFSASSQTASVVGGGRNAEDAAPPVVAESQDEAATQPNTPQTEVPETKVTNIAPTVATNSQETQVETPKSGWKWQNLLWIGLGIIVILGLVRFICDHYIR